MKLFVLIFALLAVSAQAQTFTEEEVSFQNGEIQLSGTLSFPDSKSENIKAIILVSGSGPQNRDSEVMGMKPFKLLADFLNGEGFAVLRYDDRGVGKSTGPSVNESTSADLAEDVFHAFKLLQTRPEIDPKGIGILGHSEGGIIAPMVAAKERDVAFIILAAGFGVKGIELSNVQQAAILRSSGMTEEFISASTAMNKQVLTMMADPAISDEVLSEFVKSETLKLLELLPENIQSQIPNKDAYADMAARQAVGQAKIPWIRYYMGYDPLPTLKLVKCPVLLLFGELDTQVLPSQNSELMESALVGAGNTQVESVTISGANHLFQEASTGNPSEYATLKKEFAPAFTEAIGNWLSRLFNQGGKGI